MKGSKDIYHELRERELYENPMREYLKILKEQNEQSDEHFNKKAKMIVIDDNYELEADSNQCILVHVTRTVRTETVEGKYKKGDPYEKRSIVGFHSNIDQALRSYYQHAIRNKIAVKEKSSIDYLLEVVDEISNNINNKFKLKV